MWRCRKRAKWVLLHRNTKNTENTPTVNLYVSFWGATSSHDGICSSVVSGGIINHQEVFGSFTLNSVSGAHSCWNFNAVLHPEKHIHNSRVHIFATFQSRTSYSDWPSLVLLCTYHLICAPSSDTSHSSSILSFTVVLTGSIPLTIFTGNSSRGKMTEKKHNSNKQRQRFTLVDCSVACCSNNNKGAYTTG